MYVDKGWHPNSHVRFPAMALKSAMGTAALATPGIRKTDVSRLVFMPTSTCLSSESRGCEWGSCARQT